MHHTTPPSLDDINALAKSAWDELPAQFRDLAGDIVIVVQDFAEDDILAELEIEDPFELTGLYQGIDLTHASVMDPTPGQTMVFLYRRPILDEWTDRGDVDLAHLVAHVLVHEIGHHFGLSDEQMDAILDATD